tara:strand:- start:1397 stop:2587 length:1191 start_codon:yes stop_codon:yes gene_type:complete
MLKISKRGQNMPESPIRKLVPYSENAKQKGINVLHLNIGQPDILPPSNVIEKINNFQVEKIEYSHSAGIEEYRRKIAKYYSEINNTISYKDILITTGGSEALSTVLNCICDPGDEIIIPDPYYANYNGFSNAGNIEIKAVKCTINKGFQLPKISDFEKKINKKTRAILICNPGNPTGALYTLSEIKALAKLIKQHNLFLIADEVYREFTYDQLTHHSILTLEDIQKNTIVIDSISKRYSLCGARIGCIVSKNKEVINTALKFSQARLSPPIFGQLAGIEALNTKQSYFTKVIKEYTKRRNTLVDGLNTIPGVKCPKPKGAFYCIAELPVDNTENFCRWLLEKFHFQNTTIMLAPASGFYSMNNSVNNQVRIAYVLEVEKLKLAIKILQKGIEEYNN